MSAGLVRVCEAVSVSLAHSLAKRIHHYLVRFEHLCETAVRVSVGRTSLAGRSAASSAIVGVGEYNEEHTRRVLFRSHGMTVHFGDGSLKATV